MSQFSRLNIKPAAKSLNSIKLPYSHLTTFEFGQIIPLLTMEILPRDEINGKFNVFSRMAPLVKPTYGKFSFRTMNAFVPLYQLADDAEAVLAGKTTWEGEIPSLRYIYMNILADVFMQLSTALDPTGLSDDGYGHLVDSNGNIVYSYEYKYTDANGSVVYSVFNGAINRYCVKLLNALGYAIPQKPDFRTTSTWYSTIGQQKLSAMPLLAFAKAYNDWMSQSTRYNTSLLTSLLKDIKHNKAHSGYNYSTHSIGTSGVFTILNNIDLIYENDYFMSAWQSPNSPLSSVESINTLNVPASDFGSNTPSVVRGTANVDFVQTYTANGLSYLSQRSLDFLKSFDDWVRRNNYSGSRAVQQIYSKFGIKTDDYRSNYVHVLDTSINPINVGDVMAMADTSGAELGDYAGKGILSSNGKIQFKSSDYGYLFVMGWFAVTPMNPYGFDKSVLRVDPMDFYNAEFDGLGADAISFGELFENPIARGSDLTSSDSVYGFTERYNSYRYLRSKITGAFRDYHKDGEMNTWHTGRLLNTVRADGEMLAQHPAMENVSGSEWNRIFSITDSSVDHFYLVFDAVINALRPIQTENQVVRLGEGNLSVPRNGNEIN